VIKRGLLRATRQARTKKSDNLQSAWQEKLAAFNRQNRLRNPLPPARPDDGWWDPANAPRLTPAAILKAIRYPELLRRVRAQQQKDDDNG
jgi:hypothetical protein